LHFFGFDASKWHVPRLQQISRKLKIPFFDSFSPTFGGDNKNIGKKVEIMHKNWLEKCKD
jgi:hypothetical protein